MHQFHNITNNYHRREKEHDCTSEKLTKTTMKKLIFPVLAILMLGFALSQSSCKKKKDTEAEITLTDSIGKVVAGAVVYVNSRNNTPPGTLEDTQTSDNRGKTFHKFDNEAILQVEVSKKLSTKTITGYGILRLEEGKKVELSITVR